MGRVSLSDDDEACCNLVDGARCRGDGDAVDPERLSPQWVKERVDECFFPIPAAGCTTISAPHRQRADPRFETMSSGIAWGVRASLTRLCQFYPVLLSCNNSIILFEHTVFKTHCAVFHKSSGRAAGDIQSVRRESCPDALRPLPPLRESAVPSFLRVPLLGEKEDVHKQEHRP